MAIRRSAGTVAQMLDISPLYNKSEFSRVQEDAYNIWSNYSSTKPYERGLTDQLHSKLGVNLLGQYYFINGTNGTLSPKFDFTSSGPNKGNRNAFVVATRVGDIPAPNPQNIDWVELNRTSGNLANEIIRVNTKAGQPPSSVSISRSATMTTNLYCPRSVNLDRPKSQSNIAQCIVSVQLMPKCFWLLSNATHRRVFRQYSQLDC
jgi:hypothetical protein